jgi:hypothetical protein
MAAGRTGAVQNKDTRVRRACHTPRLSLSERRHLMGAAMSQIQRIVARSISP